MVLVSKGHDDEDDEGEEVVRKSGVEPSRLPVVMKGADEPSTGPMVVSTVGSIVDVVVVEEVVAKVVVVEMVVVEEEVEEVEVTPSRVPQSSSQAWQLRQQKSCIQGLWHLSEAKCSTHVNRSSGGISEHVGGVVSVVFGIAAASRQSGWQSKQVPQQNPAIHSSLHLSSASSSSQVYHQSGDTTSQILAVDRSAVERSGVEGSVVERLLPMGKRRTKKKR